MNKTKRTDIEGAALEIEAIAADYTDTKMEIENTLTTERSAKDIEGLFTTLTYKRVDLTIYKTSVLSGGTTPAYTTRTVVWYDTDGTTPVKTDVYALAYDVDGDFESEVLQ